MEIKRLDVPIFGKVPWQWSPAVVVSTGCEGVDSAALDTAVAMGIEFDGVTSKSRSFGKDKVRLVFGLSRLDTDDYGEVINYIRGTVDAEISLRDDNIEYGDIPFIQIKLNNLGDDTIVLVLEKFLEQVRPRRLLIHGTPESKSPGVYERAQTILLRAFGCRVPLVPSNIGPSDE